MSMILNLYGENPYEDKYRSFGKLIIMISTYSFSYFYIGYTLAYFTTFGDYFLNIKYGLATQGFFRVLYIALVTFGAAFGAFISQLIIEKLPKRQFFMILNGFAIFIGCLMFWIDDIFLVFILRFLQGLCVGLYYMIVPSIIKDFCPSKIADRVRAVNYSLFALGLIIVYTLAFKISSVYNEKNKGGIAWNVVIFFPLAIIAIQTFILQFIFPFQNTQFLLKNNRIQQAQKALSLFYRKYYVIETLKKTDSKIKEIMKSNQKLQQWKGDESQEFDIKNKNYDIGNPLLPNKEKNFQLQQNKYAMIASLSIILVQQFSGLPTLTAYGFFYCYNAVTSNFYFPIIVFLIMFISSQGAPTILDKINRKTLALIGTVLCVLGSALISYGMYYNEDPKNKFYIKNSGFVITGLVIFALNYGCIVGPVFDVIFEEIVPNKFFYVFKAGGWGVAGFILMGSSAAWKSSVIFLIFSIWAFISIFVQFKVVIETKGKSKPQIQDEYTRLIL